MTHESDSTRLRLGFEMDPASISRKAAEQRLNRPISGQICPNFEEKSVSARIEEIKERAREKVVSTCRKATADIERAQKIGLKK